MGVAVPNRFLVPRITPLHISALSPLGVLSLRNDPRYKERRTCFYTECIRRGLFIQPYHHWYINYRHTEEDLERALAIVESALTVSGGV
jgi:hypothetical protein